MMQCSLDKLGEQLERPVDAFICCASFEPRAQVIAAHLPSETVRHAVIAYNANFESVARGSREYLCARFDGKYVLAETHTDKPVVTADALLEGLESLPRQEGRFILVDITTFTREALLILFRLLREFVTGTDRVWFGYNGAARYSNDRSEGEEWLSLGVRDIRSVLGYPGVLLPSRPSHLVVLVGFEIERAVSLIEKYEPAVLSLGYGSQERSITGPHHETNRRFHEKLAALYVNVRRFEFAPDDAVLTQQSLKTELEAVPGHNVVVAPMNTKISTLGAALAAIENEEVQLCYAQAQLYNISGYATPKADCYLFQIPGLGGA